MKSVRIKIRELSSLLLTDIWCLIKFDTRDSNMHNVAFNLEIRDDFRKKTMKETFQHISYSLRWIYFTVRRLWKYAIRYYIFLFDYMQNIRSWKHAIDHCIRITFNFILEKINSHFNQWYDFINKIVTLPSLKLIFCIKFLEYCLKIRS